MSQPFIGQISMFGGNFAPRGWAVCDGQLLPIASYSALFSILGTTYGGDGRTNFGLPDLRGRAPVHNGNGPGLSPVSLGEKGGAESFTITSANQLPAHSHQVAASTGDQTTNRPTNGYLAAGNRYTTATPNASMGPTETTGAGAPIGHRSPYTAVNFIIALQGIFPSRN